ncbi:hypothetical protein N657DRAFT_577199, partial [Parathielavia appendiculata]
ISRFNNFRTARAGDKIFIGNRELTIKGYSVIDIYLRNVISGKLLLYLDNVAFIPEISINQVSPRPLYLRGIW